MSTTAYLLARGWRRSGAPADEIGECGVSNPETGLGFCTLPARWSKPHSGKAGWPQCALHARQAESRGWTR